VRFRLKTVMQTLMSHAAVLTEHARALTLKLGRRTANSPWLLAVLRVSPA
jgi:hypothetical protein